MEHLYGAIEGPTNRRRRRFLGVSCLLLNYQLPSMCIMICVRRRRRRHALMFCCRHILPIVCDCVVGIGFGGLWRFAGPFTKVSTTVPVSICLVYATPLL